MGEGLLYDTGIEIPIYGSAFFRSCSSSSGIEQESLPTVSSSVGARNVRHTQM